MRAPLAALASLFLFPSAICAQGITVQVGRLFDDGGWTAYSVGWIQPLVGPLHAQFGGMLLRGPGTSERLFGATVDASLFRGGAAGIYVVGGMGGGIGAGTAESWWRSWSAGVGYELVPASFFTIGIETRYREMLPRQRSGAELALRLATNFGGTPGATGSPARPPLPRRPVAAGDSAAGLSASPVRLSTAAIRRSEGRPPAEVARDVIEIAEGEVGRRYRLGGTGDPGDGFDCSGLIQYAYQRVGIALPRRSVDQARAGQEVGRDEATLLPGDVLTFSGNGRTVTHVGLYIGDGRFIHSASRGVQVSRLGEDDPNGRYWYRRWVGARRVLEAE